MSKTAVITGAGSGVGQAVAIALAKEGWQVAILGRRETALQETKSRIEQGECLVCPCDIGQADAVAAMAQTVLKQFGSVQVLVNAAGTNVPRRSMKELSSEDYHAIMDANLNGAYYCVQAFLPGMREQKSGTIVHVASEAGKRGNAFSGPAYILSKFGMAGLNEAINAEERVHGIRSCALFPGDIATPLLDKRPNPPSAEARQMMMTAEDVASCVLFCINMPARTVLEEILLRPA